MPSKVRIGRAGPMVLPCKFGIANALRARYWLSSGATLNAQGGSIGVQSGTVSFWGMQCEIGYSPTWLESPGADFELAQRMRYNQFHTAVPVSGFAPSSGTTAIDLTCPVAMRAAPSVTVSSTTFSNASTLGSGRATFDHVRMSALVTATGYGVASTNLALGAEI